MKKISIEIASDPQSLEYGLMFRKSLKSDSGMLFVLKEAKAMSFWGANTYIPLDIAFIGKDKKIQAIKSIIPLSLKSVRSSSDCLYALETNMNFFKNNNIEVGYEIDYLDNILTFKKPQDL
jgi:uncharacterized membrane protein (UPF0127 family)